MITCKTCGTSFPKPVRRGRPPSQCDDCKGGNTPKVKEANARARAARSPQKAVKAKGEATTPTQAVSSPSVAPRAGKKASYVSGFCNPRHAGDIHKLCSSLGGACTCGCHQEAS